VIFCQLVVLTGQGDLHMDDRLMTIKQLAAYLNITDRTVLKLVTDGVLPGVKVGNQWRFRKAMIDTWLDDQMLGVVPRCLETAAKEVAPRNLLSLPNCFEPSQIIPELTATNKNMVVDELAALANKLGLVRDKTWFVGALIERENVLPSAIGNGIAFLHTLRRNPGQIVKPFMVLGRSRSGIDFDALDGKPTHLFFVLGLKFEELHLPWLHKLSHIFSQHDVFKTLLNAPNADTIYQILHDAEQRLGSSAAAARSK